MNGDMILNGQDIDKVKERFINEIKSGPFYKSKKAFEINNLELFKDAVWQGYLDASRTFIGINSDSRIIEKTNRNGKPFVALAQSIKDYFGNTEAIFDHSRWCLDFIQDVEKTYYYPARYGQAQKVVNMAFKYLLCCDGAGAYKEKFEECHMPFDQFTLLWVFQETGTYYLEWSWFNKDMYIEAQKKVREMLGTNTLEAEFLIWEKFKNVTVNLKEEYAKSK